VSGVWVAVLATSGGCYLLKVAGLTVPQRVLSSLLVRRFAELVPVALLAALAAVQTFGSGKSLRFEPATVAGMGAAVVALLLRAPFLVVIAAAAGVAAVLHAAGVA
jgi:branched-subunit amino acid transport protein